MKKISPVFCVVIAYLILAAAFNVTVGIGEAPDEPAHMGYAQYMARYWAFPVQTADLSRRISNEAHQPPAYYVIGALLAGWVDTNNNQLISNPSFDLTPGRAWGRQRFYHTAQEWFPYHGLALAYHLLRGFSTILGAITVWAVYQIARIIKPQHPLLAPLAAGLVAFNPQFLFITASVNNDNMATAVTSLMLLAALQAWQRPSLRATAAVGLLMGLAALSKYTALAAAPGAALALAIPYMRPRHWRALTTHWLLAGSLACVIAGWWYARNWHLYGDPLAHDMTMHVLAPVRRYTPWQLAELPKNIAQTFISSWGLFGWTNIALHPLVYFALAVMCLVALAGLVRICWRLTRTRGWSNWNWGPYGALALAGSGVIAAMALYHLSIPADQGRLFFPGIAAFSIFLALGLLEIGGHRSAEMTASVIISLIATVIASLILVLGPAYALPTMLSESDLHISHPLDAQYGGKIALRGFDISPTALRPGQSFNLTFYWQALQPIDASYWLLIQTLDPNERPVAHYTSMPYLGRYATALWQPGDMFADPYELTIVPDALPGAAQVSVVLKPAEKISVTDQWVQNNQPIGDRVWLTTLKILPDSPPIYHPGRAASVRFGNQVRLIGYDSPLAPLRAGQPMTITLYWQALASTQNDYHVFVHLICANEQLTAQHDGVPNRGWYPSIIWAVNDLIQDEHVLEIPSEATGNCALSTGMYDFASGIRLEATDANNQQLTDNRALLLNLDIQP